MCFPLQLFQIKMHRYKATNIIIHTQKLCTCLLLLYWMCNTSKHDFRLPPRCWWDLHSSGIWHPRRAQISHRNTFIIEVADRKQVIQWDLFLPKTTF
jgi:hypothetical protein